MRRIRNSPSVRHFCAKTAASIPAAISRMLFTAIAIVGAPADKPIEFCPPCGMCRQVMTEFCDMDRFKVVLSNGAEEKIFTLRDLMPYSFDNLNGK